MSDIEGPGSGKVGLIAVSGLDKLRTSRDTVEGVSDESRSLSAELLQAVFSCDPRSWPLGMCKGVRPQFSRDCSSDSKSSGGSGTGTGTVTFELVPTRSRLDDWNRLNDMLVIIVALVYWLVELLL